MCIRAFMWMHEHTSVLITAYMSRIKSRSEYSPSIMDFRDQTHVTSILQDGLLSAVPLCWSLKKNLCQNFSFKLFPKHDILLVILKLTVQSQSIFRY